MEEKQYPVGINVLGGAGLSQAQHIALIAEAGWDAFFTGWDPDRIGKWADAGARAGLTYASVHAPFGEVKRVTPRSMSAMIWSPVRPTADATVSRSWFCTRS